jgi:hypothetical protein
MIFGKLAKKNKATNPQTVDAYRAQLIEEKIAQRYTPKQEIAIIRQRDTKPAEFKEYFDFVEKCKDEVDLALDSV